MFASSRPTPLLPVDQLLGTWNHQKDARGTGGQNESPELVRPTAWLHNETHLFVLQSKLLVQGMGEPFPGLERG